MISGRQAFGLKKLTVAVTLLWYSTTLELTKHAEWTTCHAYLGYLSTAFLGFLVGAVFKLFYKTDASISQWARTCLSATEAYHYVLFLYVLWFYWNMAIISKIMWPGLCTALGVTCIGIVVIYLEWKPNSDTTITNDDDRYASFPARIVLTLLECFTQAAMLDIMAGFALYSLRKTAAVVQS